MQSLFTHHCPSPFEQPQQPSTSPARTLDLARVVGATQWAQLPLAVQRRFAVSHSATTYHGHLDLRCSGLGRWLARLSQLFGAPLTGIQAKHVPTTVQVYTDGRGGMVWERCFHDSTRAQVVRSTKHTGAQGQVIERTDGGLSMDLQVSVERGHLIFQSTQFRWYVGRWCIPIPALLTPGVCRVEHEDQGQGQFRFTLSMTHPLWGQTFYQTGLFTDPQWSAV